jgi:hypothetical protein
MAEISTHIAEAVSAQPASGPQEVTNVLDRLGSPDDIVQAAAEQGGTGEGEFGAGSPGGAGGGSHYGPPGYGYSAAGGGPAGPPPGWPVPAYGPSGAPAVRPGVGLMEIAAIALLLFGAFLAGIGWVIGVVLLWLSPRWRLSDKLLGTFVWPGGLAAILVVLAYPTSVQYCGGSVTSPAAGASCPASGGIQPGWLLALVVVASILLGFGGPIAVAVRLARRARRWSGGL